MVVAVSAWDSVAAVGVVALKVTACVLVADFASGFFHWLEDTFWRADTPILGRFVIRPNIVHHRDPRDFVKNSWLVSADVPLILGALFLLGSVPLGLFNWTTVLAVVIAVNANEVHKWSHRTRSENGRLIVTLQRLRILQTPAHHAAHHRGGKDTHYCTVTNLLNPVLDAVRFWRALEWFFCGLVGITKRPDPPEAAEQTVPPTEVAAGLRPSPGPYRPA